jgi:LPS O-antigen subunit length determinant protein (WzzB/FepE family)
MAQNLTKPSPYEDEINLREIIQILIESKKLIISTILIFIIASIIYSLSLEPSIKSSAKLEIGYVTMNNGDKELIQSPSALTSDLKILIMKNPDNKYTQKVSINSFENKVIKLETISSSVEQNEDLLNEVIRHIHDRDSKLTLLNTDQKKDRISNEIETIQSKVSFIKAKQFDENQAKKLTINRNLENIKSELSFIKAKQLNSNQLKQSMIEDRIATLKSDLPIIDLEISQFEKVIIEDTNNLSLLKRNEETQRERASNSPTLEQIIFSYKSEINDLNAKKFANILETKSLNNQLTTLENITLQSDELFRLEQERKTSENQLTTLEITVKTDELFRLEQERKTLENQLQKLMTQTQVKTQLIGNIETKTIKPKTLLLISLSIILGFITSILLVFINNFIKSYQKSIA